MSRPARINVRIDPEISYGFECVPEFYTQRSPLRNGHLAINAVWDRMKHNFAGRLIKRPQHYMEVKRLFAVCRGDVSAHRIKDWFDYVLTDAEIGTATGAEQEIQLARLLETGGYDYVDVIEAPVAATLVVKAGATLGAATPITATVDELTGIVTCTATAGHKVFASCEFDRWVRLTTPRLPASYENYLRQGITLEYEEDFGP